MSNLWNLEFVETGSDRLAVYTSGNKSSPALVMLHGSTFTHEYYESAISKLNSDFYVITPDLRGHGKSPVVLDHDTFTIAQLSADLSAIVHALELRDFYLQGTSLGSAVSLEYVMSGGLGVQKLVVDLPAFGPRAQSSAQSLGNVAHAMLDGSIDLAAGFASEQVPERTREAAKRFFMKSWEKSNTRSLANVILKDRQFDCREERLRKIMCPTFVCGHRNDPVHPYEAAEWLASLSQMQNCWNEQILFPCPAGE